MALGPAGASELKNRGHRGVVFEESQGGTAQLAFA